MKELKKNLLWLVTIWMFACNPKADVEDNQTPSPEIATPFTIEQQLSSDKRSPLLLSRDYGQSWVDASYNLPPDLQVSFMESRDGEIVLASDNKGIFLSSHNKTQWKAIGDDLPNGKIIALHVKGERIYASVYKAGIFLSIDEGGTWISLNYNLPVANVQAIGFFDETLFAGTDTGIFKLSEKAPSWETSFSDAQILSIYEFGGKLIAGTNRGTLLSKDYGKSWQWIRKEGAVHYTRNIEERIIELCINGDLYFSDDWGENWAAYNYQPRQGSYVYELVKMGNHLIMSNNYGIHRSLNNGQRWDHIYSTESLGFFDFLVVGQDIYAGTRTWDEYRGRK